MIILIYISRLHTFFAAIPGFLNAMVYGFTKDVKQRDKEFVQQYLNCCSKNGYIAKQRKVQDEESEDDEL